MNAMGVKADSTGFPAKGGTAPVTKFGYSDLTSDFGGGVGRGQGRDHSQSGRVHGAQAVNADDQAPRSAAVRRHSVAPRRQFLLGSVSAEGRSSESSTSQVADARRSVLGLRLLGLGQRWCRLGRGERFLSVVRRPLERHHLMQQLQIDLTELTAVVGGLGDVVGDLL